jgi:hypothetical protein
MSSLHTLNGKPIDATAAPTPFVVTQPNATATAAAAQVQAHKAECGNVGITGEHGDLGTNAK